MKIVNFAVATAIVVGANLPPGFADGFARNGHINGPYTTLELTGKQVSALSHGTKIALTPLQQNIMLKATGVSGVKQLEVFPRTVQMCTDFDLANAAIRISNKSIEVADFLFGFDFAAAEKEGPGWEKWHDEWLSAEQSEKQLVNPPKEVQLRRQASRLRRSGRNASAIPLLQEAIKINPNYKWARRDLASVYYGMAGGPYGPITELPHKIDYCKKALALLNGHDTPQAHNIQRTLDRIHARMTANN